MRRIKKVVLCLLIFLISASNVYAKEKVVFSKCVDGDTIKVKVSGKEKTVRMLAVDTPESVHPSKGIEYYGKGASEYTCDMVTKAKKIELEYDKGSEKEDKYDRLLAWIWVDDVLLQDELIKNGYAEVAYLYGDYRYTSLLKDHQAVAEETKIGIWNEEARKEFDASNTDNDSNDDNTKKDVLDEININDMSLKEIIVFIIIVLLLSIITPIVNKYKRKLKKLLK